MHQTPETLATVAGSPSPRLETGRPCAVVEGKRGVGRGGSAGTGWVPWGRGPGGGWAGAHFMLCRTQETNTWGSPYMGEKSTHTGDGWRGLQGSLSNRCRSCFAWGTVLAPLGPVAALGKGKMGRRDRGPQTWRKVRDPTCSPLPFLHSRLLRAGEHLLQAGEPHRPPEAESRVAPRW